MQVRYTASLTQTVLYSYILCSLINHLQPGAVKKVNTSEMSFKQVCACLHGTSDIYSHLSTPPQMENIGNFINACAEYGVRPEDSFQTVDLYEATNMTLV